MRKTVKSKFLHVLESDDTHREKVKCEVLIIDAMALIQTMKIPAATFGELSLQVLSTVVKLGNKFSSKRIDFVGDCYPDVSIKGAERDKRSVDGGEVFTIVNTNQKVLQYKTIVYLKQNHHLE